MSLGACMRTGRQGHAGLSHPCVCPPALVLAVVNVFGGADCAATLPCSTSVYLQNELEDELKNMLKSVLNNILDVFGGADCAATLPCSTAQACSCRTRQDSPAWPRCAPVHAPSQLPHTQRMLRPQVTNRWGLVMTLCI